jgi:MFS transporter, PAT family, beta-lactamase induction signal transducer AmpG
MALCNVTCALSAKWQGHAAERFGYPVPLGLDAAVGLVCLLVLPFVAATGVRDEAGRPRPAVRIRSRHGHPRRSRALMAFRLPLPDLLATRKGRLTAFFLLYMTEGIPLGFTATAIATQMRRMGVGPAEIGLFVGSLYLPWAWKWVAGPFVDTFSSDRFGRRRLWIFLMQIGMVVTLLVAYPVDYVQNLQLFTTLILIHNAFGATQDVAIDALANNVLPEHERGVANGFMFGGASVGQTIGGSAALWLSTFMPFRMTYFFVTGVILLVTIFVVLPLREQARVMAAPLPGSKLRAVLNDLRRFVVDAVRAFFGSRAAFIGLLSAILPLGAYALALALQSTLAVELGLSDGQVAQLNLFSTVIFAVSCIAGGWLSDRFGRRRTLGLFVALTLVPTLFLAWQMQQAGWIQSIPANAPDRPVPPAWLIAVFWTSVLVYNVFQGLYYGIRSALFMDITTPAVAATQFTAYMALQNFAIAYTSQWQGISIERYGYPMTQSSSTASPAACPSCSCRSWRRSGATFPTTRS